MKNLFKNIDEKNINKLLKKLESTIINFKKDSVILSTSKNENIIGIITKGLIKIIRTDYNGNRTIIEELGQNDIFSSYIYSIKNSEYDIVTVEDTEIIIIDYLNIINYDENSLYYIQFIKNILEITNDKVQEKNNRIEILTKKSIRDKLLEYFNQISKKNGSKNIYLPFTFTDLADYLSVDRRAMSRELKNLKDEGFINIKQKRITLLY